jgi:hypothetical protein
VTEVISERYDKLTNQPNCAINDYLSVRSQKLSRYSPASYNLENNVYSPDFRRCWRWKWLR